MKAVFLALLALFALVTAACTPGMMENSARERAQSDCNRIPDAAERAACMRRAEYDWGTTGGTERRAPPPR
jgi:hypothetical protein